MGWSEFVIVMLLIFALIAAILFWQIRSFTYAAIFGLLFAVGVYAMMHSPLGDQIRKELQEDKVAASQVKGSGEAREAGEARRASESSRKSGILSFRGFLESL